jgi:hypothetical protein
MSETSTKNIPTTDGVPNVEPGANGTPDATALKSPLDATTVNETLNTATVNGALDTVTERETPGALPESGSPDVATGNGTPAETPLESSTPHGTSALANSSVPSGTALLDNDLVPSENNILSQGAALPQETALQEPPHQGTFQETLPQGAHQPVLSTPPYTIPQHGLRLRMKVWTDPRTRKRYLLPVAFMRDLVRGQPVTDVMYSYAVADGETKTILLTAHEWNSLPFFYFQEDGHAPRGTAQNP